MMLFTMSQQLYKSLLLFWSIIFPFQWTNSTL